jgi:hypothetical protein
MRAVILLNKLAASAVLILWLPAGKRLQIISRYAQVFGSSRPAAGAQEGRGAVKL